MSTVGLVQRSLLEALSAEGIEKLSLMDHPQRDEDVAARRLPMLNLQSKGKSDTMPGNVRRAILNFDGNQRTQVQ